ncbi:cysteine dioxygenase family protein [bacterium]|nr:cysteine dioxygenase family protein [bacterium]MCI0601391.1 cysteine dioxygenase family protein [bacterium]
MVNIGEFVSRLSAIPETDFTLENVLTFLRSHPVDIATLAPYLYFSSEHYTRNLIHKTPLFELIAVCWDKGQKSVIHNHRDQKCWMAIPYGRLMVHNFTLIQKDISRHFCDLKSSVQFELSPESPGEVDPEEPVHQVLNLPSYDCRAVSLHVYSKPFDTCEVYDLKNKCYEDMPLVNTSEYGVLKMDIQAERVKLA